ncbi:MAG: carbohydrate kinase [Spirochaetia bacterium]|nr:carbohydrate kinase [Spirochaetia bacterium]
MAKTEHYIGFDCGNSSIRTVLGSYDGKHITTKVIHQVPNRAMKGSRYEFWGILYIFYEMQKGFKLALDEAPEALSFGISTWGIDFGLLGASKELLTNPLCYRNPLGKIGLDGIDQSLKDEMFYLTGIQNHIMNSLYQILGIRKELPEYLHCAKHLLLIPDLLNYLFTGEMNSEASITSTTQLLDMRTQNYCTSLFEKLELDQDLFAPLISHTSIRGLLREDLATLFASSRIPSVCVPSHDTASAVVAVPSEEDDFVFISSGTWSLIGTELSEPIINEEVHHSGFTNEGGALGTITLLKNSAGMHILEHIKREMEFNDSTPYSWDDLIDLSRPFLESNEHILFDPNDESLFNPKSMIKAIKEITTFSSLGPIIASAYCSLVNSYVSTIREIEHITGNTYEVIHIIGGGARNDHLNQMTANLANKRVIAGPVEATSLGITAMQILHTHPTLTIKEIRRIIKNSSHLVEYEPKENMVFLDHHPPF